MPTARASSIPLHVEAAKRLLDQLEDLAERALEAMQHEDTADFLVAVGDRERVLAELNDVVTALAQERITGPESPVDSALLDSMAHAASAALESHAQLMARTQMERDRLASALERAKHPDSVAYQYAATTSGPRLGTFSVTG